MVDVHSLHPVVGNGEQQVIHIFSKERKIKEDGFRDHTRRKPGTVTSENIAAEENKEPQGKSGGKHYPLLVRIFLGRVKNRDHMADGEEKKELTGIEVQRAKIFTKGNQQIQSGNGIEGSCGIILQRHNNSGEHGNIEGEE